MMTKKDYVLIAETINNVMWIDGSCPLTIARLVGALGVVLEIDNPRFDEERFRYAALMQKSGFAKFSEERHALGL
jgi:hypothetical protein